MKIWEDGEDVRGTRELDENQRRERAGASTDRRAPGQKRYLKRERDVRVREGTSTVPTVMIEGLRESCSLPPLRKVERLVADSSIFASARRLVYVRASCKSAQHSSRRAVVVRPSRCEGAFAQSSGKMSLVHAANTSQGRVGCRRKLDEDPSRVRLR